ncbi:hypothetical protein JL721_4690 [Aureococcus anophagefferens]|nr:hypothetical protein JL721_4690 [Aureococcus anophagefferens]
MADGDLAAAAAAMLKKDADDDDHVSVGSGLSSDEEDAAPRKPAGGASQSEERKRLIAEKMSRIGGAKGGSAFAPPARRRLDAPDATTSSMAAAADELRKALGGEGDDDEPPSPAKSKRSSLGSPAARASPTRDLTADTLDKAARTLLGEKTDATSEALNRAARTLSPTKELDGSRRSSPTKGLEAAARRVASPTPPDVEADLERAARALSTPDDLLEAAARKLAEEEKKRGGGTDDDDVAAAAVALAEAEPDAPRVVSWAAGDVVDAKFRGAWAPATVLGAAKESSKKGAGYDVRYDDGGVAAPPALVADDDALRWHAGDRAEARDGETGEWVEGVVVAALPRGGAELRFGDDVVRVEGPRLRAPRDAFARAAAAASRQLRSFLLSKGPRTRDQLLAAFKDADADGSGVVDRGEFRALLEDAGLVVDETRATAAAATETVGVRVDASFKLDLDQATTAIIAGVDAGGGASHEDLVAFALEDAPRDGDAELAVVADAAAAALRGPARASGVPDPGAAWDRLRKAARADAKKATLDASALKKHLGQAAAVVRRCLDPSGDGAVTLAEFAAFAFWPPRPAPDVKRAVAARRRPRARRRAVAGAALFRALDRDGNGALGRQELVDGLGSSAAASCPTSRGRSSTR